jgi:hypothetical protein
MGGPPGGMMASRRRMAAEFSLTPTQAMQVLGIQGTGDLAKDKAALRSLALKNHPDQSSGDMAAWRWRAVNVLMETYIRNGKPLPGVNNPTTRPDPQVTMGGGGSAPAVDNVARGYVSEAVRGAQRLIPAFSQEGQFSPKAAEMRISKLGEYVHAAAEAIRINLLQHDKTNTQAATSYKTLTTAYRYIQAARDVLNSSRGQVNQEAMRQAQRHLEGFAQVATQFLGGQPRRSSVRRASANLNNLTKAQRLARSLDRRYWREEWYLGSDVINDRHGIGISVRATRVPVGGLRESLDDIPLILTGPACQMVQRVAQDRRHLRLASLLVAGVTAEEVEGPNDTADFEKELRRHERLVKRVYNHITSRKRLYGSFRYLARKLGLHPNDLVRVIGQLIVEGKISINKNKKFEPLPPPHKPVPTLMNRSSHSLYGIDRGSVGDKRVDQLMSHSPAQFNLGEGDIERKRDIRERPHSKFMPNPTDPN